jgi:hypothetical protein
LQNLTILITLKKKVGFSEVTAKKIPLRRESLGTEEKPVPIKKI